ncbi:MAG: hypothetical protein E7163_04370 [Firmicutes bacterium]|nr:hypothetical protein [Bacillota bacterium]
MKKGIIITLASIGILLLCLIIDLLCIFNFNKPIFAIKTNDNIYKGLFYDVYNCREYSIPQIKLKGTKFFCAIDRTDIGAVKEIVDTTKNKKDFACAEALESFYEDANHMYFYSCIKSKYIIVRYESGFEETVENALKYGTVKIEDLDRYNIDYIKYKK